MYRADPPLGGQGSSSSIDATGVAAFFTGANGLKMLCPAGAIAIFKSFFQALYSSLGSTLSSFDILNTRGTIAEESIRSTN